MDNTRAARILLWSQWQEPTTSAYGTGPVQPGQLPRPLAGRVGTSSRRTGSQTRNQVCQRGQLLPLVRKTAVRPFRWEEADTAAAAGPQSPLPPLAHAAFPSAASAGSGGELRHGGRRQWMCMPLGMSVSAPEQAGGTRPLKGVECAPGVGGGGACGRSARGGGAYAGSAWCSGY